MAINHTLEELDAQIAELFQQLDDLDAAEPWNQVRRKQLTDEIYQLQRQYDSPKRRASGSSELDSLPSPRKRQMLSDAELARELHLKWETEREDSTVKKDEELAWRLYQDDQGANKGIQEEEEYKLRPPRLATPLRLHQPPPVQQPVLASVAPQPPSLLDVNHNDPVPIIDDDSVVDLSFWPDDIDGGSLGEKIRESLAEDNAGEPQFEPWFLDEAKQAKVRDFFKMYGIDNTPNVLEAPQPIDWFQALDSVIPDPLGMPDPLANMPVEQVQQIEAGFELANSQLHWRDITLPPLRLGQIPPHLLIADALMLNQDRRAPIHNPQINQYIDYVRHDPTKTIDEIKKLLENIRPDMDIPPENREGTPEALVYPLMEHQKLGLAWMKAMEEGSNKGGILADDMGLGKTIQAIALIVARPSPNPRCKTNLIIAPLSLLKQWEREFQKKLKQGKHQLSIYIHHGNGKKHKTFNELTRYDVVLTTFGTLAAEYRKRVAEMERLYKK